MLVGVCVAAAVALLIAAAALASAVMYRFRMPIPKFVPAVPVTLILPATGTLPRLADLFQDLRNQTLRPTRLLISVESRDDPAFARIAAVAPDFPELSIETVVAGISDGRGQKCTNILAALNRLGESDAFIVLFDADIRPQRWWLAALVGPVVRGEAEIINGYRWPVPQRITPGAVIVTAIDRAIGVLVRLWSYQEVWGGSMAMRRSVLDALDLPQILDRAVCEDLLIGARAASLNFRVIAGRSLRIPEPAPTKISAGWRFARRQYQLVRIYRMRLWIFAFAVATADLLARTVLVAGAAVLFARDGLAPALAIATLLILGLCGSATAELRFSIGRRLGIHDSRVFVAAHHLLVWMFFPTVVFHASAIAAGFVYSPLTWAHVRYRIDPRGRVVAAARSLASGAQSAE